MEQGSSMTIPAARHLTHPFGTLFPGTLSYKLSGARAAVVVQQAEEEDEEEVPQEVDDYAWVLREVATRAFSLPGDSLHLVFDWGRYASSSSSSWGEEDDAAALEENHKDFGAYTVRYRGALFLNMPPLTGEDTAGTRRGRMKGHASLRLK